MKLLQVVLLLAITITIFISCTASKKIQSAATRKFPPDKLQSDFLLLKKILEANHPSLYWYTAKDSIDFYFYSIYNSITDSLTEAQFRNKVAWFISKIRCGHTAVRYSKQYSKYAEKSKEPFFPLFIKAWRDSLVVLGSPRRQDSIFKRGTIITSINNMNPALLLDSMRQFISTDGYSDNFKDQLISFGFPLAYKNVFGLSKEYSIGYLDSSRKNKIASINNYIPDSTKKTKALKALFPNHEVRKQQLLSLRNITVDSTAQTAYIKLAGFSQGSIRQFYRNSFKAIKELHINNLVIDVRENGGGNIGLSTTLTKYVSAKPFHFADTVAAVRKNFYCSRYIHPAWLYSIIMTFTARKKNDERFHFNFLEHHVYRLKKNFHYSGNIYIVQGGFTFSAATAFVSHLKGQPNVTVVGEETGGGYYGNSAVHLPVIKLPTTKLRITLPVYRIVTDSTRIKNGRGILPDVFVGPSSNAIRQGIDAKMQKVRELIEAGKKE